MSPLYLLFSQSCIPLLLSSLSCVFPCITSTVPLVFVPGLFLFCPVAWPRRRCSLQCVLCNCLVSFKSNRRAPRFDHQAASDLSPGVPQLGTLNARDALCLFPQSGTVINPYCVVLLYLLSDPCVFSCLAPCCFLVNHIAASVVVLCDVQTRSRSLKLTHIRIIILELITVWYWQSAGTLLQGTDMVQSLSVINSIIVEPSCP